MKRNVEIKARLHDVQAVRARVAKIAQGDPEQVVQEDVFFCSPRGRLKLRILSDSRGELIFYQRPDILGPKTSTYLVASIIGPRELQAVLAAALGIRGTVRKQRLVYTVGRTRIHIDEVEGLGHFLELEVVLNDHEDPTRGEREAHALMEKLGIRPDQLVEGAYLDLLEKSG